MRIVFVGVCLATICGLPSPGGGNPVVVMETSMGVIKVELFQEKAPATVRNFLQYVDDKHYDHTIFHRVIAKFVIQGGGYDTQMKEKPSRPPIKNESSNGLSNVRGTIAAARTNVPDSATNQFYINVEDNIQLDRENAQDNVGYCVFGRVIEGMETVQKIRSVKTGVDDLPVDPIIIRSIRRIEK